MKTNPITEPIFIPIIAPRYTPNTPIFKIIPKIYAHAMLKINSLNIVRARDLKPDPTPWYVYAAVAPNDINML